MNFRFLGNFRFLTLHLLSPAVQPKIAREAASTSDVRTNWYKNLGVFMGVACIYTLIFFC